jgi:hypothetical protein
MEARQKGLDINLQVIRIFKREMRHSIFLLE